MSAEILKFCQVQQVGELWVTNIPTRHCRDIVQTHRMQLSLEIQKN